LDCNTAAGYKVNRFDAAQVSLDAEGNEVLYLGIYESESRGFQEHPTGKGTITDTRTAPHTLVLTSYEGVAWSIEAAPGSGLKRVITSGYYEQIVTVTGATVKVEHKGGTRAVCGYSHPYNGGGCDTNVALKTIGAWAGAPVSHMAGCYQASTFRVSDDAGDCKAPSGDWEAHAFSADDRTSGCKGGQRFVKFNAQYNKWVGAELCSDSSYKLYLGDSRDGAYAPIADSGGHGQDHCELVNPSFSIPDDDEVTSGGCSSCSVVAFEPWSWPGAIPVYVRATVGQPFELESWLRWDDPQGPISPYITAARYSCGVNIP